MTRDVKIKVSWFSSEHCWKRKNLWISAKNDWISMRAQPGNIYICYDITHWWNHFCRQRLKTQTALSLDHCCSKVVFNSLLWSGLSFIWKYLFRTFKITGQWVWNCIHRWNDFFHYLQKTPLFLLIMFIFMHVQTLSWARKLLIPSSCCLIFLHFIIHTFQFIFVTIFQCFRPFQENWLTKFFENVKVAV